ncbi:MAG: cytochrome c-type biogenesis protein CcmH [Rickettsia endosymbiont of Ixodes persulcatus]|nr:cytochrome c-type biogenesis protein CcmH [Rickettsia endosymbiont of Ixodes persulcatus]
MGEARKNLGRFCCWIFFSMLFCPVCFGSTEMYPFDSVTQKMRFQRMTLELRCLVCQNQNLADSNAPLAQDLRQIISQRIKRGESEQCIKKYLVSRYGEYILFKPLFSPLTYLLWLGPFILLVIIAIKVVIRIKGFESARGASNFY